MQGKTNIILCDHADGCDEWTLDDYANLVDTVNGVRITTEQRALGWLSIDSEDFCPEHALARQSVPVERITDANGDETERGADTDTETTHQQDGDHR